MKRLSFRPGIHFRGRKFHGLRGFEGKPFHPPLTDIPIGAYIIAPLLDGAAYFGGAASWAPRVHDAAGYVYLVGAVFGVATALTGFADWLDTKKGTQIRRMANAHAWTMVLMTALVLVNLGYRYLIYPEPETNGVLLGLAVLILGLDVLGGMIGGSMVYDFGFNVQTAADNPVYHPSERDILDPHDNSRQQMVVVPDLEKGVES